MDKLFMIADDLTGALDAGVAFASAGIRTCVGQDDFFLNRPDAAGCSVQVTVAQTRHLSGSDAFVTVFDLIRKASQCGFTCIYKKTDSALRGNPGAELGAVLAASGEKSLCFVPAFPKMNRVTRNGVQYIDGTIPVAQSVFGADPFNPVRCSSVPEILAQTSQVTVHLANPAAADYEDGIFIFDAKTQEDILQIARHLVSIGRYRLLAGCAGLAGILPQVLQFPKDARPSDAPSGNLAVFCGSINPISLAQCQYAVDRGAPQFHLIDKGRYAPPSALAVQIAGALTENPITVFDTGSTEVADTDPRQIAGQVSLIIRETVEQSPGSIPFIIGGDTLLAFVQAMGIQTLVPVDEIVPGVVLSKYHSGGNWQFLISKSGGFGGRDLLVDIYAKLNPMTKPQEV